LSCYLVCNLSAYDEKHKKSDLSIALLVFFALKALFYKAFMRFSILFEISLKKALEGSAVASLVAVFVSTE